MQREWQPEADGTSSRRALEGQRGRSEVPGLLDLQRTAGNRVVGRLLARRMLLREIKQVADEGASPHARWWGAKVNEVDIPEEVDSPEEDNLPQEGDRPIIIELMEGNKASALQKVDAIGAIQRGDEGAKAARVGITIGFNERAKEADYGRKDTRIKPDLLTSSYAQLMTDCQNIVDRMQARNVLGAVFPVVWSPTEIVQKGYTFPFLEMRARVTLHKGNRRLIDLMSDYGLPLIRSMDADVLHDPLLEDRISPDARASLDTLGDDTPAVLSGGYEWDARPKDATWWGEARASVQTLARWNGRLVAILALLNETEHKWRKLLAARDPALVYWPEPNTYMTSTMRLAGAEAIMNEVTGPKRSLTSQQRETIFYLKGPAAVTTWGKKLTGEWRPDMATTKPLKTYFDQLRDMIKAADRTVPDEETVREFVREVRQTHFSPSHLEDIQKWYGSSRAIETDDLEPKRRGGVGGLTKRVRAILGAPEEKKATATVVAETVNA